MSFLFSFSSFGGDSAASFSSRKMKGDGTPPPKDGKCSSGESPSGCSYGGGSGGGTSSRETSPQGNRPENVQHANPSLTGLPIDIATSWKWH